MWDDEEMQGHEQRAEEKFFCYGTGDIVAPADPTAKCLMEIATLDP